MVKRLSLLLLCLTWLSIPFSTSAKNLDKFIVRTYIVDAEGDSWKALDSVKVDLVFSDSIHVPFKLLTGDDKTKMIKNGEMRALVSSGLGKYELKFDRDGYDVYFHEFKVSSISQEIIWIPTIKLTKERKYELDEMEIVHTAIKMVMHGDTIVYDAAAFDLAEGSMLDALVKQLPGAELSSDGRISVSGRFISSLLINGKDFFQGDANVALNNLPSYTVKNIKVYDKEADDAYLTHSNAKLSRNENDENLVMDIMLKKEYSVGWIFNAEAGYGLGNRYQGRLFGLGFTDSFRLSAYGNANNIKDTGTADTSGEWRNNWNTDGEMDLQMGGLDYIYDKNKWKVNGNLQITHESTETRNETASTQFFESGNIYGRRQYLGHQTKKQLVTSHSIQYSGDNCMISFQPYVDWMHTDRWNIQRSANFSANPDEAYRMESLDSLFLNPHSSRYNDILINRLGTTSTGRLNDYLNANVNAHATIRPKHMKGPIVISAGGHYSHSSSPQRTIYQQTFGPNNDPTRGSRPIHTDRYSSDGQTSAATNGSIKYSYTKRNFGDVNTTAWSFTASAKYLYSYDDRNMRLDTVSTSLPGGYMPLPSLNSPENAMVDYMNSYYQTVTTNTVETRGSISFSTEPTAPSDSGINPAASIYLSVTDKFVHDRLIYNKPTIIYERHIRRNNHLHPSVNINFNSANDKRNLYAYVYYQYTTYSPSLNYLVNTRSDIDPMNIYLGNTDGLRNSESHYCSLNLGRYGRSLHDNFNLNCGININDNSIAQARYYNKETGVSIYRPENINGNWNTWGSIYYYRPFGSREQFSISTGTNVSFSNSVDYITSSEVMHKSTVKNTSLSEELSLTYKFKNGSVINAFGKVSWNNARSLRENFRTINAMDASAGMSATVNLPWEIMLKSDITMYCRRGYEDRQMNTTEFIWNASISKSILKGNLTFKLNAVDILAQLSNVRVYINAQARTETWRNTVPRYAMLHVIYRFNHSPKKNKP